MIMKKFLTKCLVFLGVFVFYVQDADAQRVALKTNVIDWATLSPNMALEVRLDRRWTLDLSATGHPFSNIAGVKLTHFRFQPELRYWFNRPMARHFMGFNLLGGFYNMKFNDTYYDGDIWALGVSYGYALVLSKHWNMEATIGFGYGHLRACKYGNSLERPSAPNFNRWVPVASRLGISFSYVFE